MYTWKRKIKGTLIHSVHLPYKAGAKGELGPNTLNKEVFCDLLCIASEC